MNKVERLQAILHVIQTRRTVRAEDLAVRFGVHIRTIYRDVNALIEAGLPIGAEAGRGYFILEGHYLPPVMFTKDEAFSLLLAGKFLAQRTTERFSLAFGSASEKIRAQLRGELKDEWAALDERIKVDAYAAPKAPAGSDVHLDAVNQALAGSQVLYMRYRAAKEEVSLRQVEPIGLLFYHDMWHLIGWCKLRKGYRDFRLDRMQHLDVLSETFVPEKRISISEYVRLQRQQEDWTEVRLFVDEEFSHYIRNVRYSLGYVSETKLADGFEMLFTVTNRGYFTKWLLMLGNHAKVLEPVSLHDVVAGHVRKLMLHYGLDQPSV